MYFLNRVSNLKIQRKNKMKTIKVFAVMLVMLIGIAAQSQEVATGTSPQYNNAIYISQSIPGNMNSGQSYGVSVTMKNTGNNTWRQGNYTLRLASVSESIAKTWMVSSVDLNSTVGSGEVVIFNFSLTAPQVEGNYNMQWQMAEGNSFFGEYTMNIPIAVTGFTVKQNDVNFIDNNAKFIYQQVQSEMDEGQTYDVTVIMKNTGSTTWKTGQFKLLVSTKGGDNSGTWSVANVELSSDVYPDSEVTFNFKVTAPKSSGTYNFQCQVSKDGLLFGEPTTNVILKVS
jgi:hypothetical protein